MHVCHEGEGPYHGVGGSLLEALPGTCLALVAYGIKLHSVMSQLSFFGSEPFRGEWEVRQDEEADNCNNECNCALKDKEPAPAGKTHSVIKTVEDTCGNETSKSGGKDIACIQDRNSSSDFFASVENRE